MKTRWKVFWSLVGTFVVGAIIAFSADALTMEHYPAGKERCEVAGLAQGRTVFNDENSGIWLECPNIKTKRPIQVQVPEPRKFSVKGFAVCDSWKALGGLFGIDRTSREPRLENCEPEAPQEEKSAS